MADACTPQKNETKGIIMYLYMNALQRLMGNLFLYCVWFQGTNGRHSVTVSDLLSGKTLVLTTLRPSVSRYRACQGCFDADGANLSFLKIHKWAWWEVIHLIHVQINLNHVVQLLPHIYVCNFCLYRYILISDILLWTWTVDSLTGVANCLDDQQVECERLQSLGWDRRNVAKRLAQLGRTRWIASVWTFHSKLFGKKHMCLVSTCVPVEYRAHPKWEKTFYKVSVTISLYWLYIYTLPLCLYKYVLCIHIFIYPEDPCMVCLPFTININQM